VAEESRLEGTIGMGLYFKYLRAGANVLIVLLLIVLSISAEVSYMLHAITVSSWQANLFCIPIPCTQKVFKQGFHQVAKGLCRGVLHMS